MALPCVAQTQKDTKSIDSVSKSTTNSMAMDTSDERTKFFYDSKGRPDPMDIPWHHKDFMEPASRTHNTDTTIVVRINVEERLRGQVNGIVYSETKPDDSLALIGTQIVKLGDIVTIDQLPKSAKVSKINKQDIILLYEGKTYPVKISGS